MYMTPDMQVYRSVQTCFVRWESEPESAQPRREVRRACIVDGRKMLALWASIGQPGWSITDAVGLTLFHVLGGNAVVSIEIAERHVPDWVGERVVGQVFMSGFVRRPDRDKHAPTLKQRMRVLKRDRNRCRSCGRTPDSGDVHVHLEVHHIQPWEEGGLTIDENLITLCSTCHRGLDPHFDPDLYDLIGRNPLTEMGRERAAFHANCRRYREAAVPVLRQVRGQGVQP